MNWRLIARDCAFGLGIVCFLVSFNCAIAFVVMTVWKGSEAIARDGAEFATYPILAPTEHH